jgi:hypothetical protein
LFFGEALWAIGLNPALWAIDLNPFATLFFSVGASGRGGQNNGRHGTHGSQFD